MRNAPSSRITSPFRYSFSMQCSTSAAYSEGFPIRFGNGTDAPRLVCTSSVMPVIIGVSMIPGAIASTRIPNCASSRAAGMVSDATPPFDAAYAACPICPSNAATDAVDTITQEQFNQIMKGERDGKPAKAPSS